MYFFVVHVANEKSIFKINYVTVQKMSRTFKIKLRRCYMENQLFIQELIIMKCAIIIFRYYHQARKIT